MMSSLSRSLVLLIGGLSVVAVAVEGTEAAPRLATKPAAAPAPKLATAHGVVKSVGDHRLTVESKEPGVGPELLLVLDAKTVVTKRGKTVTAKDVRAGDPVTVAYAMSDGRAVARHVWVRTTGEGAGGMTGRAGGSRGK